MSLSKGTATSQRVQSAHGRCGDVSSGALRRVCRAPRRLRRLRRVCLAALLHARRSGVTACSLRARVASVCAFADIQEVIGSAIAILLLSGGRVPLWGGVLITAVDAFFLLFLERLGVRLLEALFGLLIGIMVASFGIMYASAGVPTDEVIKGFLIPRLPLKDVSTAMALVGSLLMPHNIYLHSALVLSRKDYTTGDAKKREAVKYFSIESAISLAAATAINLFVVAVFARGFYDVPGAPDEIGLENAGQYLGETYGAGMVIVWALGLLAAGQSSTMTGTYTGQFVMQGYLDLKVSPWARIAITRSFAIVPTMFVALAFQDDNERLDSLNQGLNLLQSVQLPFALVPLLSFTSSAAIMGPKFVNNYATTSATLAIGLLVVSINFAAVYGHVLGGLSIQDQPVQLLSTLAVVAAYLAFLVYLVVYHFKQQTRRTHAAAHAAANASQDIHAPLLEATPNGNVLK